MDIHPGYVAGCIGRIVELHARYYAAKAGFGLAFEAKVAAELAGFCRAAQPDRDGLWLALDRDEVLGSIAIDGGHAAPGDAHLRWFILAEAAQGRGLGSRLLDGALEFCRSQGHRRVSLWTFEGLDAARHLYEKHGFRLVRSQLGSQWGTEVREQLFAWGLGLPEEEGA
ncbi:GNAT family N-acetyltransferase [Piscinibacter sakaiensis]|uniref:Transcriptional regulator, MarR family/acetyltransferase (GNAT) n=1 Tax=Piscinibacter sakaiensis TaxID=1547922 RepID=A0A0K8P5L1_PISS1|nr:GNAT family N-acetyltransferase [Piscinibacter sakaiensis]GAP37998.1 transcriptional regulator, MarR family/acetyltransferase (GNAT) [Piscinibacter sakaiensis]